MKSLLRQEVNKLEKKYKCRCPMIVFGLCKHTICPHGRVHSKEDGCHNHKIRCGVNIGCAQIGQDGGLIVDAEIIEDFIYKFVGMKTSWYPFYIALLKIVNRQSIVVPKKEDYGMVMKVKDLLERSLMEYRKDIKEKEILGIFKGDKELSFEYINTQIYVSPYRSGLKAFLDEMVQKNMLTVEEREDEFYYRKKE